MRKLYFFKTILLLCALVAGSVSVWADVSNGDVFERISAVGDLEDGDEIIFVNQAETYACGTTQNTNNRTPVSITVSNHSYTYASSDNVQVFVVKINDNGKFGFHTGSGYIYSASNSKNNLKTNSTAASTAPSGTAAWTLDISSNVVSAKNVSNTSYYLAFNGTSYFSQYSSGQSKPYIYKKVVPSVATPTFSPAAGTVAYGTEVTLSQADGKTIHYTSDDTDPTSSSPTYSTAIAITSDMTIKAIAVDGSDISDVATAAYTVQRPDAPEFSDVGEVELGTEVTVTAPDGCTLYYTTNSEDPIESGTSAGSNSKVFTITEAQTIKAASKDSHGFFSSVATAVYTIAVFDDPTFSVADMTLFVGEQKAPTVTTNSGGVVTFTSGNTGIATIVDGKINAVAKGTVTITANLAKDKEKQYKAATTTFNVTINLAPVWESTSKGIDVLTWSNLELDNASGYTSFSNKGLNSYAKYQGKASSNNGKCIQLNSNNTDYGIVSTVSGGNVRKVIVSWYSSDSERNLDVYANTTAYTEASDLYDSDKRGSYIGSFSDR